MTEQKNIVEFPERDRIEAEAAKWTAVMDSQEWSNEDRALFERWLSASPAHKEAMDRMSAIWSGYDVLDDYNRIDPIEDGSANALFSARPIQWVGGAVAATLLIVASFLIGNSVLWNQKIETAAYATIVGEQKSVTVADGSRIVVNTDSEIAIDFTRSVRKVTLLRGEAHFEVARDPDRPFQVYAADSLVEAIGTAFAVRLADDDDVEVTVSEGVVKLLAEGDADKQENDEVGTSHLSAYHSLTALVANQSAVIDEGAAHVERIDEATIDRRLAWRNGLLIFDGEPLVEAIEEIGRYTDTEIIIDDPTLAEQPVGGVFEVGDIEAMFDALDELFDVNVMRESPSRVILTRR